MSYFISPSKIVESGTYTNTLASAAEWLSATISLNGSLESTDRVFITANLNSPDMVPEPGVLLQGLDTANDEIDLIGKVTNMSAGAITWYVYWMVYRP